MDAVHEDLTRPIFEDGVYRNPWPGYKDFTWTNIYKFLFGSDKDHSNVPGKEELDNILPVIRPDFFKLSKPPVSGIQTMWIGHATVLVQFDGVTVLTDPVFSQRCSPFRWLPVGNKRYRPPPCEVEELPQVDAVVISHTHYDHLDYFSVKRLNDKFGDKLQWFVPIGTKKWMTRAGCKNVVELSWWEEGTLDGKPDIKFICTPTQHWCRRTLTDVNKALWGSWVVQGPNHSFYFAGDTGYCAAFKQIGKKYGPFTLAAIPIGAYEPRWVMKENHVNPEEAVQIHEDVRANKSVAIHWGTFSMAYEPYLECLDRLAAAIKNRKLTPGCFFPLRHGEVTTIGGDGYEDID